MNVSSNFLQNIIKPFKFNPRKGETFHTQFSRHISSVLYLLSFSFSEDQEEDLEKIAAEEQKEFTFQTLVSATNHFHPDNKLGHGDFGPVFKGKLEDGRLIVVKKVSHASYQMAKELVKELRSLTRVQHRNIASLLGYCVHPERLLVYEYVVNGSLDKLLFEPADQDVLDWKRRYDVICGVARGLRYLHENAHECFIHRDMKATNILLNEKWVPKITDFGMARLYPEDQAHVNTRVADVNGYIAPEYAMHGTLTVKTDVYGFGVLVLELVSGQKNSSFNLDPDCKNLLDWAYKMYKKGKGFEIMESRLAGSVVPDQVATCVQIGLLCTQADPQLRPTMDGVLMMLPKKAAALDEPIQPGIPGTRYRRPRTSNLHLSSSTRIH